jgi:hypothetical protein
MSVATDDDAMKLLETEQFDLVLVGRKSQSSREALDQRLRQVSKLGGAQGSTEGRRSKRVFLSNDGRIAGTCCGRI